MQLSASVCRCQTSPVRASCSTACFILNVSEAVSNFAMEEYQTIVTFPSPTPSRTDVYPSIPRWGWLHSGRALSSHRNTNHLPLKGFTRKRLQVSYLLWPACFWPGIWTHNLPRHCSTCHPLQKSTPLKNKRPKQTTRFVRYFPINIHFNFISLKRKSLLLLSGASLWLFVDKRVWQSK